MPHAPTATTRVEAEALEIVDRVVERGDPGLAAVARPGVHLLKSMGYRNAKAMYVAENFKTYWIDKGYPVER